jgi:hypothetical protein
VTLSLPEFSRRMTAASRALSGADVQKLMTAVGAGAVRDARSAVPPDLGGDHQFSGWPKAQLDVKFTPHRTRPGVTVHPTQRGAGPWRVAEQGRNQGNASGIAGPGINRRTGETARRADGTVRRQRARRARRWNGRTDGKGTWSDAVGIMGRKLPARVRSETAKLVARALGGK